MRRRQTAIKLITLGVVTLIAGASETSGQAARAAASLHITLGAREATQGDRVLLIVGLRNYKDEQIAAQERIEVTVQSDLLAQPVRLTIPVGRDSARTAIVFNRPGIAKLKATAPKLAAGYAVIAIKRGTRGARVVDGTGPEILVALVNDFYPAISAAQPPPQPVQLSSRPSRLWLEVLPPRVTPRNKTWTARVLVAAVNGNDEPIEVPQDLPVELAALVGTVTPDRVIISKGSSVSTADVRVISETAGTDTVFALSPVVAGKAQQQVEYEKARPAKLFVSSSPAEIVTSGRSSVRISVMLKDDDDHVVPNPDRDVRVVLQSTLGTLTPHVVTIVRGRPDSEEVVLTSARAGRATVTADAEGLLPDSQIVRFILPWLLLLLAALGGVAGTELRSSFGRRRGQLKGNLAFGSLLGVIFFGLTLFGVPGLLPSAPGQALEVLALNEIGAFLLGVFGGYLGRRFLDTMLGAGGRPRPSVVAT